MRYIAIFLLLTIPFVFVIDISSLIVTYIYTGEAESLIVTGEDKESRLVAAGWVTAFLLLPAPLYVNPIAKKIRRIRRKRSKTNEPR